MLLPGSRIHRIIVILQRQQRQAVFWDMSAVGRVNNHDLAVMHQRLRAFVDEFLPGVLGTGEQHWLAGDLPGAGHGRNAQGVERIAETKIPHVHKE